MVAVAELAFTNLVVQPHDPEVATAESPAQPTSTPTPDARTIGEIDQEIIANIRAHQIQSRQYFAPGTKF